MSESHILSSEPCRDKLPCMCLPYGHHAAAHLAKSLRAAGFHCGVNEAFVLLGCYAPFIGIYRRFGTACRS